MSNNPPGRVINLSEEHYQFLLDNCDANIRFAVANIQQLDAGDDESGLADKLQEKAQTFHEIRTALEQAE